MKKILCQFAVAMGVLWVTTAVISALSVERDGPDWSNGETTVARESALTVGLLTPEGIVELPMEVYITGVLAREMPANFHSEAKKAQAIAARTFALNTARLGLKHGVGIICPDPECCQGYLDYDEYMDLGGSQDGYRMAQEAAEATRDLVITYDGALIDATYFSCSGGKTEAALAVWGSDIPYLQAVDSPGEEEARFYTNTEYFSVQELEVTLGINLPDNSKDWINGVTYTDGGGVQTMGIGGKEFAGTQLRKVLGLRSQSFTVTVLSGGVLITTRGWGHRVGMSQYGAEAMAKNGCGYEEILTHYYQGVEIRAYEQ